MVMNNQTTVRPLNIRLINSLRHSPGPVAKQFLESLYENPEHLRSDIRVLARKGMIHEARTGLVWAGT